MAETLVSSLKKLAREKRGIREKERVATQTERRVIERIARSLSGTGYRLVPVGGDHFKAARPATTPRRGRAKRFRCPNCDRRFAHPLPMARHLSATHGMKRRARRAAKKRA
jgi:uncharacterized C2H2 Zn-finger protein